MVMSRLALAFAAVACVNAAEQRKIVTILGAPCAGCGTQSPNIVHALDIPHLDTGNMLREASKAGTPAGLIAGKMMKEGVLVTDEIVERIIEDRIAQPDCNKGFLLDGFPRNEAQAAKFDQILSKTGEHLTDAIVLNVPIEGLQQCVMHRWTADGGDEWTSNYIAFREPKSLKQARAKGEKAQCEPNDLDKCNMWDDWTGEPLFRRADDNLKTLAERVKIFEEETTPVINYYKKLGVLRNIDAYQPEPKVWSEIAVALGLPANTAGLMEHMEYQRLHAPAAGVALFFVGFIAVLVSYVARPKGDDLTQQLLMVE